MEIDREKRRSGLEFAHKLWLLAAEAPAVEDERDINRVIHKIQTRYGRSTQLKKAIILTHVRNGATSIRELVEETGLHKSEVHDLTKALETENKIKIDKIPAGKKGGRPAMRIFLVA